MDSTKNPILSPEFSKYFTQSFRSKSPAYMASLFFLTLFFFALIIAGISPAFTPQILSVSNSSSFFSSLMNSSRFTPSQSKNYTDNVIVATAAANFNVTLLKKPEGERSESSRKEKIDKEKKDLISCDLYDGNWVVDYSKPNYAPGSCPFIDDAFNCIRNGRPDFNFTRLWWKPKRCKLPRLDGKKMLEMLRGKRLVFVGDSLNRNMWESLVCMLRESLEDKKRVCEISGRHEFRTEGFYAFRFADFNSTIEFVRSPFLVQEWEVAVNSTGTKKETLRLDVIQSSASKYRDADIIIFNSGHWWTHEKTSRGKDYYQEGNHVYAELNVVDAYKKALQTWANWVDATINYNRTRVFFRGYSASHYRGGQWNSGGSCNGETGPITNDTYLAKYPRMMSILESVITDMRTPVSYLNITRMTDYRKDGHPSIFRQPAAAGKQPPAGIQDCSHWCLPGVPDAWNELLYTELLVKTDHFRISPN
ncbi:TRICHOME BIREFRINGENCE-LIKE 4 [Tasmannia lanceolata]|uniref:TRICHOME BIREFRINGENCE-LIKE 4 n=1 Tax=Tasmannia lanceolata TaxID=3420 RepID=UPI004062BCFC